MVYRIGSRPSWYFDGLTPRGWKQLCTHTPDKRLGQRAEGMWDDLARRSRAWDILGAVLAKRLNVAQLHDLWLETRGDVEEIRRRLNDADVSALVADWHTFHAGQVRDDSAAHALAHVRHFFPEDTPRLASSVTVDWITSQLAGYPGKRNTRRKVHSSLSVFLEYCTSVKGLFPFNPMLRVSRPAVERSPIRFYELDEVERIVDAQSDRARRAFFALVYGTGMEISVALDRTRAEINAAQREIRAPGTKTHTRDRIARIADWAWPIVWDYARTMLPNVRLFPADWSRWTVSDWHRATVQDTDLNLSAALPFHNARHHWAVRRLRSGSSIQDVQLQLGHESAQLTLNTYGRFMPSAADRDRAEQQATAYEAERRKTQ